MLLIVLDGAGDLQTIISPGQEVVTDRSGAIVATDTPQELMAVNTARSGFFLQNIGETNLYINDLDDAVIGESMIVSSGGIWPPPGYPVSVGSISISGTQGCAYVAREW